jgi:hypothetical protein
MRKGLDQYPEHRGTTAGKGIAVRRDAPCRLRPSRWKVPTHSVVLLAAYLDGWSWPRRRHPGPAGRDWSCFRGRKAGGWGRGR